MNRDLATQALRDQGVTDIRWFTCPKAAVIHAAEIEARGRKTIAEAVNQLSKGTAPEAVHTFNGFYPRFGVAVPSQASRIPPSASSGFVHDGPGLYTHTASRVQVRTNYYVENLTAILNSHPGSEIAVWTSDDAIPVDYVANVEALEGTDLELFQRVEYDTILKAAARKPSGRLLSPYEALEYDYHYEMLRHYTGTDPRHLQSFCVLFNYKKYEPVLLGICRKLLRQRRKSGYSSLVVPDDYERGADWAVPSFHLVREDGNGISFFNVGVGAPTAVTVSYSICAVGRPHLVFMAGHCGGTRKQQQIGNFVLASGYSSFCGATRFEVPAEAQISPLGEVQRACKRALAETYGWNDGDLDEHCETGTLVSIDFRHWVIQQKWYSRIAQSMPAAVDMESAEVARACWANRTPYGFMGLITDIPPYNRPKLKGLARKLYEETKESFVRVPILTCEKLRDEILSGKATTHSRKICPPFMPPGDPEFECLIPYAFA